MLKIGIFCCALLLSGLIRDVNVYEINDKTGRISVNASATVMLGTYTLVVTAYNSSSVENSVSDLVSTLISKFPYRRESLKYDFLSDILDNMNGTSHF